MRVAILADHLLNICLTRVSQQRSHRLSQLRIADRLAITPAGIEQLHFVPIGPEQQRLVSHAATTYGFVRRDGQVPAIQHGAEAHAAVQPALRCNHLVPPHLTRLCSGVGLQAQLSEELVRQPARVLDRHGTTGAALHDGALEQRLRCRHCQQRHHTCGAGRFAKYRDVVRIATERSDVVANPFERSTGGGMNRVPGSCSLALPFPQLP